HRGPRHEVGAAARREHEASFAEVAHPVRQGKVDRLSYRRAGGAQAPGHHARELVAGGIGDDEGVVRQAGRLKLVTEGEGGGLAGDPALGAERGLGRVDTAGQQPLARTGGDAENGWLEAEL